MALRRMDVGKNFKNPTKNSKQTKPYKTEKMFKNEDELMVRKVELEKQRKEVIVNVKLLRLQYR